MSEEPFTWQQVELAILTRCGADQEARAARTCAAMRAAGLGDAVHLPASSLAGHATATGLAALFGPDHSAAFRAAVAGWLADRLEAMPDGRILLVQIIEDDADLPICDADEALEAMLRACAKTGFVGQALCWPNRHHVRPDCLALMDADVVAESAFCLPSPAMLRADEMTRLFLRDWTQLARDPSLALGAVDHLAPPAPELRDHAGAWAVGSVLRHLRGLPVLTCAPAQDAAAQGAPTDGPAPAEPWIEQRLIKGGMRLCEAARLLAEGQAVLTRDPRPCPTPERLRIQLSEMLATGQGRICPDHLRALVAEMQDKDLLLHALAQSELRTMRRLQRETCAQMNMDWAEMVMHGRYPGPEDLPAMVRRAARAAATYHDDLCRALVSTMIWLRLGRAGRIRFRRFFGAFISGTGREAMGRHVDQLSEARINQILDDPAPDRARILAEMEAYIAADS